MSLELAWKSIRVFGLFWMFGFFASGTLLAQVMIGTRPLIFVNGVVFVMVYMTGALRGVRYNIDHLFMKPPADN